MQKWVVVCWGPLALVLVLVLALAAAEECPDGGRCGDGQTCCDDPANGFECCPFDQAECCSDHTHCCPSGTMCHEDTSSCVNDTASVPWAERASAAQPTLSKSFRMIKAYTGEEDDNICPDQSRCPPEFSCLKALTKFGCCPLPQGVSCSDGKHCCPESHRCSADSRSCVRQDLVAAVLCRDGVSECPDQTTCCQTPDGTWGCCPLPKAVCCEDQLHCCPEESTCDVEHSKCISLSTKEETPMWAKLPARIRAEWENKKEGEVVTAETANTRGLSPTEPKMSVLPVTEDAAGDVPCDATFTCPAATTCCKTKDSSWACCPLPEAVCCDDHEHCCPKDTTCDLATLTCDSTSGSTPMMEKIPAFSTTESLQTSPMQTEEEEPEAEDEDGEEEDDDDEDEGVEGSIKCDPHTSCPHDTTCCFMTSSQKWGCCPLREAVCCADGNHCCPTHYKCDEHQTSCVKGEVVIPWYTKLPAITSVAAEPSSEQCDAQNQCPEKTTCCRLVSGEWGCCPLQDAVCCQDKEHCCPRGYTCNIQSQSCQKVVMLQLETIPLTPVFLPQQRPQPPALKHSNVPCDEHTSCEDGETCCRISPTTWGCCPSPNAVCCSNMKHCCPTGYTCTEGGDCIQNTRFSWSNWHKFFANKKRALSTYTIF